MVIGEDLIRSTLARYKHVASIGFIQEKVFREESYQKLFACDLAVGGKWIPIVVGVPVNWELDLIDVYLENSNTFIPHVERNGKLCLFDLEGAIIDANFPGLLKQCLQRAKDIIYRGIENENKIEFLEEFDAYFSMLNNLHYGRVVMPDEKKSQIIRYSSFLRQGKNQLHFFASVDARDFKSWNINSTHYNGMYIYCEPASHIYPPNHIEYNAVEFLNSNFRNVSIKEFERLSRKCGNDLFIVFEIRQNKGITNCFAYYLKSPKLCLENAVEIISADEIIPIRIQRLDKAYLQGRSSFSNNELENMSYLLIGCGSIGGYVFHNLIKAGCTNITLVDHDRLSEENIYRHLLGREYLPQKKTSALRKYAENSMIDLQIETIECKVENAILNNRLDFNDYDYVIAATGNHNVNRWIDTQVVNEGIQVPVFYIWNEPLDIGSHVALFTYVKDSICFENLFSRDENMVLYDISSYCEKGQSFGKTFSGCTGTFIPYGSTTSMQSSILFMDLLKKHINKTISGDVIVSQKGDDYYFKQAGFSVSQRYINQKDTVSISAVNIADGGLISFD